MRGRKMLQCNVWLIEQVLDCGRTQTQVLGEYQRRHTEETGYKAIDVMASMRLVLRQEKQRRARRDAG